MIYYYSTINYNWLLIKTAPYINHHGTKVVVVVFICLGLAAIHYNHQSDRQHVMLRNGGQYSRREDTFNIWETSLHSKIHFVAVTV